MDDDFNTGAAIAQLFPLAALARKTDDANKAAILSATYGLAALLGLFKSGIGEINTANSGQDAAADSELVDGLMQVLITLRNNARAQRDFATADALRDQLAELGIAFKDNKDGTTWEHTPQ